MASIGEGIVVGAFGGAVAGFMITLLGFIRTEFVEWRDKQNVFN